jgi:hypothetical protein
MGACAPSDKFVSKLEMVMWPLKATALSRIFCCKPTLIATANNITMVLIAMAKTPIFIIGAETLLL